MGAFSEAASANQVKERVEHLVLNQADVIPVKVLESELGSRILHKVWLGPIDPEAVEPVTQMVQAAGLGTPIEVQMNQEGQ